ncbi:MAG: hypothetical protein K2R98_13465 [Gemmataceae bacterium]|nr:hypothetical protein [Gemmataceae bacterium]
MTSLVKKIDQRVNEAASRRPQGSAELGTYVICSSDKDNLDKVLRGWAEKDGLKRVSMGIGNAPKDYNVAARADITVVIYEPGRRQNAVKANFALRIDELDDTSSDAIVEALSKVLPK